MKNLDDRRDLSLLHLQAELARIDVLLKRAVRRWQLAGQDQDDAFRGLYVSDGEASALLERPFASGWGDTVSLDEREERAYADALDRASRRVQSVMEEAAREGVPLRLVHLTQVFGLDRFDLDTFLIALAPSLDLRYEKLYGYLQDDVTRKLPTVDLVLNLLSPPGTERLTLLPGFSPEAPLFRNHLVELTDPDTETPPPLLRRALLVDDAIVFWLLGRYRPHSRLGKDAMLSAPQGAEITWMLPERILPIIERVTSQKPVLALYGPDKVAQFAVANFAARSRGRVMLTVDVGAVIDRGVLPPMAVRLALRDARLNGAIPFLFGWDACLVDGSPPPELLAEVLAYPEVVVLGSRELWRPVEAPRDRNILWVELPVPGYAQRKVIWSHYLGDEGKVDVSALAGQFALTTGQIRDAVATARDAAAQRGTPMQEADLFAAARAHSNIRLASLARKIVPRYGWEDLVLPEDQIALLREIVNMVRGRPLVLETWGVGKKLASSSGVTVLFAGPSGTGKTMAAEVIANELKLDLYKIDLSTVVSKYIGETEKNLERIFTEAQASNAILFFDEADALFGKRSEVRDAHDRYANIEISYLLQALEDHDGVVIMATNLFGNLDSAFVRRMHFVIHFPFPDEGMRRRIWETVFPREAPLAPDVDFSDLGKRFQITGGHIRNIAVAAAFLAADDGKVITQKHILHAARREFQKMGKLVGEGGV